MEGAMSDWFGCQGFVYPPYHWPNDEVGTSETHHNDDDDGDDGDGGDEDEEEYIG